MPLQQLLLILWARRKAAAWVLLLAVSAATLVSFLLPKQYQANSSLVFDYRADPIAGAILPGMGLPNFIITQLDILQSDRVATRAVKLLRLDKSPEAIASWKEDTEGKIPLENYYGDLLLRHLTINKPGRGSNVITLNYTSTDPAFAAAAANAFAQAFVDVNVELRVEPARQYASWFDERLKTLRADLERAQSRLSAFQQAKGILATDDHLDYEAERLTALTTQLAEAEAQKADMASREKNSGSELSPGVQEDPVIQGIKAETAKAEARLTELGSYIGRNHPQYRQLEAQIAGLHQQLAAEVKRISGSTAAATRATAQKEDEIKAAIQAQKERLLKMRAERDTMALLIRDVESAQRAYDAVTQRSSLSNLESQVQQNNVSILSPAIEPDAPAKPRIAVNILAALVIGTLLGAGAAIGLEKLDSRVRVVEDIAGIGAIPVLGVLQPKPRRYTARDLLTLFKARLPRRRSRALLPSAE